MHLKNGKVEKKKKKVRYVHDRDGDARIYDQINSYAQASMDHVCICQLSIGFQDPPLCSPASRLFQVLLSTRQDKISSAIGVHQQKKRGCTRKNPPSIDIPKNQAATGTNGPVHCCPFVKRRRRSCAGT